MNESKAETKGHDARLKNAHGEIQLSNSLIHNGLNNGGFKAMPTVINQKNLNDAKFGKDSAAE